MAEYALIDGYLDTMRTRVRWRRDVEDLVAEMEDHLYSTVERFEARGTDTQLAQRQTLDRFGDPDLMADAFASTPRGGIAVPTKFTKTAGLVAIVASALWVVSIATFWVGESVLDDWNSTPYLVWSISVLVAGVLTLIATIGLRRRLGGLGGLGIAGVIILGLGVVVSFLTWATVVWMAVEGVGMLLIAIAAWPIRLAPRPATIAYGSGMLLGAITWGVLTELKVGTPDSYGEYVLAWDWAFTVGVAIAAAGLLGIGLWLRGEQPANIDTDSPDQAVTA